MNFNRGNLSDSFLLELYISLNKPRLIEEKMINLIRQGKISKWFSGIGQEAISVGCAKALNPDEYILTMHRNLGVFTTRDVPLKKLFAQIQGKEAGFTKGRDRSFHFGSKEHHIVGMISHLGAQLGVADGIGLWDKIKKEKKCTLVFSGEGGTSEGDFHESINVAAVWDLPVIFLVENNGFGLSTPVYEQFKCVSIAEKGIGYGIEARSIDGNNILEVYSTIKEVAESIRKDPRPVLIEAVSFRMGGHEEASGTAYVPKHLIVGWSARDPIKNYEHYLKEINLLEEDQIKSIKREFKSIIDKEWNEADGLSFPVSYSLKELKDVYKPFEQKILKPKTDKKSSKRIIDAVSDALNQSMEKYPELILMGQDIAEYGGVFKITKGFTEKFGKERVRNTPLCESAIVGAGLGYSIKGGKSVIEMQFADFVSEAMTQIINNLAKSHYRWGQNADVVIRMPTGAGVAAGPFHSQSNEAWFFHTPGLKVVYPSNPYDVKGLLNAAIEDPNPVMFFEHKALYRAAPQEIPDDYYTVKIGEAEIRKKGDDLTIITYGMGVHWVEELIKENKKYSVELIDLKTLLPLDFSSIEKSVKKTGKVLILHEDTLTGGIGGEISALIAEHCFSSLDAPIMRVGGLETPIPFSSQLEKNFLPKERLKEKFLEILNY
jgi:2-oxoisovalerate dehydrogenase E1 component